MVKGFGMAEPRTSTSVEVNLDALDQTPSHPLDPGPYQWGVLLVQTKDYLRLRYLGGGWQYTFNRQSAASGYAPSTATPVVDAPLDDPIACLLSNSCSPTATPPVYIMPTALNPND